MGSLAGCLRLHGITGAEAAYIRKLSGEYKAEGFTPQERNERAAADFLKLQLGTHADIIRQIRGSTKASPEFSRIQAQRQQEEEAVVMPEVQTPVEEIAPTNAGPGAYLSQEYIDNGEIQKGYHDLLELGKHTYQQGHDTDTKFFKAMRGSLGKMWNAYKKQVVKVWADVKKWNASLGESGGR